MDKNNLFRSLQLLIVLLFVLPLFTACSPEIDSRKIVHKDLKIVMEKRKQAIISRDIEAYKKVFFVDYLDGGVTYQSIVDDMKNQFANHEKIAFTYVKNPMNFKMNTARMVSMISYQTESMEKPVFHHEKTLFRRVDGKWYISGGVALGLF